MIIGISGMIASGKSTLAKNLAKFYNNSIYLEEFQSEDKIFNQFIEWFYKGVKNINLAFQAYILESSANTLRSALIDFSKSGKICQTNHIFLDRFNVEHYIFALISMKNKPAKFIKAFDELFNKMIEKEQNPNLAIFIDIDFDNFKERLFKRGRKSEIKDYEQNEEYFKELHALYRHLYEKLMNTYKIPYVIIDGNNKNEHQILAEAINIIEKFDFSK